MGLWTHQLLIHHIDDNDKKKPAMVADIKLDNVPAKTERIPSLAISGLLLGAIAPRPPSKIATEARFANPHKANEIIAFV